MSSSQSIYDYAVLDTETTGVEPSDRIIEIGVVTLDGETLEEKDRWESLVNPGMDRGPEHVHRISNRMLEKAPAFRNLEEKIFNQLDGKILVGSQLWFDVEKLRKEFMYVGAEFREGSSLEISTDKDFHKTCETYNIFPSHHWHRAICDAECTAELFKIGFKKSKGKPCQIILAPARYREIQTEGLVREDAVF